MITLEDFQKLDLRVGRVLVAQKISGSNKLLRLEVEFNGEWRQLVAGIAESYAPENLLGKEVVVLYNLEPKVIRGIESQGMLLAVSGKGGPVLLIPEREVPPGSKIT